MRVPWDLSRDESEYLWILEYTLWRGGGLYAYPRNVLGWSEHFLYLKVSLPFCGSTRHPSSHDIPPHPHSSHDSTPSITPHHDTHPHSSHMTHLHTLTLHTWHTSIPSLPTGASGADSPPPHGKRGRGFLLHQLLPLPPEVYTPYLGEGAWLHVQISNHVVSSTVFICIAPLPPPTAAGSIRVLPLTSWPDMVIWTH